MSGDIALSQNASFEFDISVMTDDLQTDGGLRTAVIVSLYTDRRVETDELPTEEKSRRGWFGDLFAENVGDLIGSRLWLLKRSKVSDETRNLAEDYAQEALQWLIDDGIADTIDVSADFDSNNALAIQCIITKPNGDALPFQYESPWAIEGAR